MKNIIVSLFLLFPLQELEWSKEERFILKSYQQYKLEIDNGGWRSLLDVAMELEKELIESKYLNSISKEDYMFFFKQYVCGDSPVNIVEIDKLNLFFSSLNYASTQARSWYIFDNAINETKNKNNENSSVFRIHTILEELFYRLRIGEIMFQKYLNTLTDEEFEKKEIYRVPILVFLYAELQQKQNEFVRVSAHSRFRSGKCQCACIG